MIETVEVEPGRFVCTPHPVTLEGQTNIPATLLPGDTLYSFLDRCPEVDLTQQWEVRIGGEVVPAEYWTRVKPKHGQHIEVRAAVNRQVLMLVAMAALTYFTFGVGSIVGIGGAWAGAGAYVAAAGLYAAGSILIQKLLGPKPPKARKAGPDGPASLSGARNQVRHNEPFGLLFGEVKIAADILSLPYTYYQGNDQYVAMVLTPGINTAKLSNVTNGDTPLSSYEGVQQWTAGMSGMPQQDIPLYSNADTTNGGELSSDGTWVERVTSLDTVRIMLNLEYVLGGAGTSGKNYNVSETVQVQYRPAGSTGAWQTLLNRTFTSSEMIARRDTLAANVSRGQYAVRARITGQGNYSGKNTQKNDFVWSTLTSVQVDEADYNGVGRHAILMKASGQLQGSPDEIRSIATADPIQFWDSTTWVAATDRASGLSNPGAQMLQYLRGFRAPDGELLAGMGMDDADINIDSFKAFMAHCAQHGYTYDFWLTEPRSHQEVLDSIAMAGMGQFAWVGDKPSVIWLSDDQPLSGPVNMATIQKGKFQVDYTLENAADGIEFTYFDRTDWQAKTLRVPAPGVTTMLNPATVQGEGITDEAHAAEMARFHMAQNLYQYKDISFSVAMQHLSFQRYSLLALQHDLTQWGFGGRVMNAVKVGTTVTLTLDDTVPAPPPGGAWIGVRIPGEQVYRVLKVKAFTGESNVVELSEPWPSDAALPGNLPENPPDDTIWIYDFKQTPGYRVRVAEIRPENGLKGASVSVVPESPEYWNYIRTGTYIPAPNQSLLQTRPVASNLKVSEHQVVQGDTKFTELTATFDVSGPVGITHVTSAPVGKPLEEVALTSTRTATWRIPGKGQYSVTVRPHTPDGIPGVAVSTVYTTVGADVPPVLFDYFTVDELSGGVRKYTFGFDLAEDVPVDLAGAEIRYVSGTVSSPDWNAATPLGEDGFFTSAVEMVLPPAGEWTFACRSRNTAGLLSADMLVLQRTLTGNLGEVIGEIGDHQTQTDQEVADALAAALAADAKAAQEIIDRQLADAQVLIDAATDATNKAAAEAQARADALLNERLAWEAAVSTETTQRQAADSSLAQSISMVSAGSGEQFDSAKIWRFDTTPEGWTGNGTPTVVDGWLRPANHATDPYVQSPDVLDVDGSAFRYLKLRIKKVGNPTWRGWARWTTTTDNVFNATKQAVALEPVFDANGVAVLDWEDVAWWPATIRRLRLHLSAAQTATNYYLLDWVAIGRPTPGASVALVQDVEQASIDRDGAEALARNTLAAQMRGTYEGTDVAEVTQGLAWSERQARVTAIAAEATRTDGIAATLTGNTNTVNARVTAVESASVTRDDALSSSISQVEASMLEPGSNLLINPNGQGLAGWSTTGACTLTIEPYHSNGTWFVLTRTGAGTIYAYQDVTLSNVAQVSAAARMAVHQGTGTARLDIQWLGTGGDTTDGTVTGTWQRVTSTGTAPAGATGARLRIWTTDAAVTRIAFNVVKLELGLPTAYNEDGQIEAISARVTAVDSASVTRDTALAGRATAIEVRMPTGTDKLANEARVVTAETAAADANSVVAGKVSVVEGRLPTGTIANEARVVAAEQAAATANSANAAAIQQVEASLGGSGTNLLPAQYSAPVTLPVLTTSATTAVIAANAIAYSGYRYGITNTSTASTAYVAFAESLTDYNCSLPNGKYRVSFRAYGASGQQVQPEMRLATSASQISGETITITGSSAQYSTVIEVAGNASDPRGLLLLRTNRSGVAGSLVNIYDVMIEKQTGSSLVPSPFAPGSSAVNTAKVTQSLAASVDSVTGKANAIHGVTLDVNGNVSGTRSENDGTKSSFSILATVFRVISTVSGMGMEWQDGYLRIWRGSGQVLLGFNFGPGDVLLWAGPNVGAAGANKANALFYIDTAGTGYFAGRVLQGVIRSFGSSTTTGNTTTTAVATPSNGKPVAIKFELLRTTFQAYNGANAKITMGGGQSYVDVSIQRRYGAGGYTEIAAQRVYGDVQWFSEPGAGAWIQHRLQNIVLATDVADTRERQYRAVLTNMTWQAHTVTNPGTTPAAVINQYTAVESLE